MSVPPMLSTRGQLQPLLEKLSTSESASAEEACALAAAAAKLDRDVNSSGGVSPDEDAEVAAEVEALCR